MHIVVAPQEYKGTLTAEQAAAAMADGAVRALPDAAIDIVPMADGGPGTVRAIVAAAGGELRSTEVTGPLHERVQAEWGMLPDGTAVIEMAAAAGLVLVPEGERDPRLTTTRGVGQLIRAALDAGSRRIVLGLGGSATNDGGSGMAQALGARFLDANNTELTSGGAALAHLHRIDLSTLDQRLPPTTNESPLAHNVGEGKGVRAPTFLAATDVRNPLCGLEGASIVYGPQKGATPEMARALDVALRRYADVIQRDLGVAVADVSGGGSAGGLGAGLIAFLGAEIRPGVEVVAEVVGLVDRVRGADLVLTGEGRLDGQTPYGKTVAGVTAIATEHGVPVIAIPGSLGEGWESIQPLVALVEPVNGGSGQHAEALSAATERAVRRWLER